jgi:curli biogenesis system outer membrane secretion channel CsgG
MGKLLLLSFHKEGGAVGGGWIPIVGLISTSKEKANMAMDVALLNPVTLEIGETKSFAADSSKRSWGLFGLGGAGAGVMGGGWRVSNSLTLDNVVRDVVFSVTNYICEIHAADKIVSRPKKEE